MIVKGFKQYNEAKSKPVVFTFGRFNPPTTGHEKLITKVASLATGSDYKIFASQSSDSKKNPLDYKEKVTLMRKIFSKHGRNIILDKKIKTPLDALVYLHNAGYTEAIMVVGSDRVSDIKTLLTKYNGVKSTHGFYNFSDGISVVSAGERDPDADDVSGMSASKMRAAASEGDFQSFARGLPKSFGDKLSLFNLLRKRMGLKEMVNFRKHVELPKLSEKRERYISGEIFNIGDRVQCQKSNQNFTIVELYSNYFTSSIGTKYFINDLEEYTELQIIEKKKIKTIKVGEDTIDTNAKIHYGVVEKRKVVAVGSKAEMIEYCKDNGGRVWKTTKQVGDLVEGVRQDPDIKDKKGTQPAPYYSKDMSKSTKSKRDAHFKKGAKKDDDDPSAYEPAPGDASAKTKPSKHTKRFKDMFGEDKNPIIDTEPVEVEEGVDDPAIFKAIFLAGGPGSGKSFTVGKTGLTALGFKIVNSDPAFEKAIEKAGGVMEPEFIFSPKGQEIRTKAKTLTAKQRDLYIQGRLGLVIDGTGKDYEKIKRQAEKLKTIGYDVAMILVNTDLETAIARDAKRDRTIGPKVVKKMWDEVQKNIGKFQAFFKQNFVIVDNSEGSNWQKATTSAYKQMTKFANAKPTNKIARDWIKKQLGEMYESTEAGIRKKAEKTGISYGILKKMFDRGVAAWRTGHRPGTTPEQWGYALVNSFATKSKGTWGGADKDLAAKVK